MTSVQAKRSHGKRRHFDFYINVQKRKHWYGCDVQNLSLQTLTRATKSSPVAAMKRTLSIPRPNTKGENQIKVFVVYKTEAVCRLTQVKEGRIFFVNHVGNTPEKVKDASAL